MKDEYLFFVDRICLCNYQVSGYFLLEKIFYYIFDFVEDCYKDYMLKIFLCFLIIIWFYQILVLFYVLSKNNVVYTINFLWCSVGK